MDKVSLAADVTALSEQVIKQAVGRERFIVAIAGPPGSGKSLFTDRLAGALRNSGEGCAIVPMDGFHLDNTVLRERGQLGRKGAPFTFDAAGYSALMERISRFPDQEIAVPVFDRTLDLVRAAGSMICPAHRIVLTEGNYLLLDEEPWLPLAPLFDMSIFLKVGRGELRERLVRRWLDNGLGPEEAEKRAGENDLKNADLVLEKSRTADLVFDTGKG